MIDAERFGEGIGQIMRERIAETRREYEGKLSDLTAKVAALEARPLGLRAFPDDIKEVIAPLQERIAALEARTPATSENLDNARAFCEFLKSALAHDTA